jgi:PqqD family protein of HPr-rel-A system
VTSKFTLAEQVVCRNTSGDLRMLFDRGKGVMYEMNETASAIIDILTKSPASAEELGEILCQRFDGPPDEIQADIENLLADFADAGLVSEVEAEQVQQS